RLSGPRAPGRTVSFLRRVCVVADRESDCRGSPELRHSVRVVAARCARGQPGRIAARQRPVLHLVRGTLRPPRPRPGGNQRPGLLPLRPDPDAVSRASGGRIPAVEMKRVIPSLGLMGAALGVAGLVAYTLAP